MMVIKEGNAHRLRTVPCLSFTQKEGKHFPSNTVVHISQMFARFNFLQEPLHVQKVKVKDPHPSWNVCQMCYKQAKLFLCSACKRARYCSRRCQTENWDDHKETCLKLRKKEKTK